MRRAGALPNGAVASERLAASEPAWHDGTITRAPVRERCILWPPRLIHAASIGSIPFIKDEQLHRRQALSGGEHSGGRHRPWPVAAGGQKEGGFGFQRMGGNLWPSYCSSARVRHFRRGIPSVQPEARHLDLLCSVRS